MSQSKFEAERRNSASGIGELNFQLPVLSSIETGLLPNSRPSQNEGYEQAPAEHARPSLLSYNSSALKRLYERPGSYKTPPQLGQEVCSNGKEVDMRLLQRTVHSEAYSSPFVTTITSPKHPSAGRPVSLLPGSPLIPPPFSYDPISSPDMEPVPKLRPYVAIGVLPRLELDVDPSKVTGNKSAAASTLERSSMRRLYGDSRGHISNEPRRSSEPSPRHRFSGPESSLHGVPEVISARAIPDRIPERVPEGIPERIPERVAERIPERVPEGMPKRIPERMPERRQQAIRPPQQVGRVPGQFGAHKPLPMAGFQRRPAPGLAARKPLSVKPRVAALGEKVESIQGQDYIVKELLGEGGTSKVYKVETGTQPLGSASKTHYALKVVKTDRFDRLPLLKAELANMQKLVDEERVIKLIAYDFNEAELSLKLVMELGESSLSQVIEEQRPKPLDVEFVRYWAVEVLKCVGAVHNHGIIHTDIKPDNFLVFRGRLKIIDFGIADQVPEHTVNVHRDAAMGTILYMPPESVTERTIADAKKEYKLGRAADVWSCGCIFYKMVYKQTPLQHLGSPHSVLATLGQPEFQVKLLGSTSDGTEVPQALREMLQDCLQWDAAKRRQVPQLLDTMFLHPRSVDKEYIIDLMQWTNQRIGKSGALSEAAVERLALNIWSNIKRLNDGHQRGQ